jgi:hypothetical protein
MSPLEDCIARGKKFVEGFADAKLSDFLSLQTHEAPNSSEATLPQLGRGTEEKESEPALEETVLSVPSRPNAQDEQLLASDYSLNTIRSVLLLRPGGRLLSLQPDIKLMPRSQGVVVRIDLSKDVCRDLLRLIDGIRAALRLALIRLQAGLRHLADTPGFLLILLATSRHYGHRSEPDGKALPAPRSMAVVRGELVLAC